MQSSTGQAVYMAALCTWRGTQHDAGLHQQFNVQPTDGRYGVLALLCLMLQAEITYATTAQHELQHWPNSIYHCTVHLKGSTA